ncbi:MAG TPA: hypothetical protein VK944_06720 [Candidatus Limnocylindria bacterium]|jgi:hypothetical protein|nr:hypothetical protein [Candidatus Limnocylindria bacterium]
MRPLLVLLALSFAGSAMNVWLLSGFLPWFLLPDFSFLAIVYSGLFLPGPLGLLVALPPALFREVTISGPPGSFFLASMAVYFVASEIGRRIFLRAEIFILLIVGGLLAAESLSVVLLLVLGGGNPFSFLWGAEEAVRIAWTSLIAVFLFMDLSGRWQRIQE